MRLRERLQSKSLEAFAFRALVSAAFCAAFSLPAGRALVTIGAVAFVAHVIARRGSARLPAVAWLAMLFCAVACVTTVFGVEPSLGLPKLRKLMWFVAIPLTAILAGDAKRRRKLLMAYAIGGGVLALDICVTRPLEARALMEEGVFEALVPALIHVGSMTDGQRLMIALLICLGLALELVKSNDRRSVGWWVLLAWIGLAFIVNFKRGSWICGFGFAALIVGGMTRWRNVFALALIGVGLMFIPAVQTRLSSLGDELKVSGGRRTMWVEVAPVLIREHPWGIGYRSLTNERMRAIARAVEPNRDHLHSNILQVLVATGWVGLAVYLCWMMRAVLDAGGYLRRAGPRGERAVAVVVLTALAALLANGLVEYNIGDGEIVLAYGFLMGIAAAGARCGQP